MKRSIVETKKAPPPVGPYSQAIQAGNTVFVSGQIALHPEPMRSLKTSPLNAIRF